MSGSQTVALLRELCDTMGVSGYEDDVRARVKARVQHLVDEVRTDALGNLIAIRRASSPDAPVVLFDAHLDEIGLVISYVEANGFLRFATVGGWDERVLPAHAVDVRTRDGRLHRGVIGIPPPHIQKPEEKNKPYSVENLFIDIGARSREEVAALGIRPGDSAAPSYPLVEVAGGSLIGKALDNRAGVTVLIRMLEELEQIRPPVTVAALFSTFEETGGQGAAAGTFGIDPKLALVLEGTVAADFPGVPPPRCPSRQGAGPAITLMDRTCFCSPRVARFLTDLAERENIPHQIKTPIFGGTNAARIHMARAGVPTGIVSVPCRYIHSPHAMLRLEDLEHTIRLALAFLRECRVLCDGSYEETEVVRGKSGA